MPSTPKAPRNQHKQEHSPTTSRGVHKPHRKHLTPAEATTATAVPAAHTATDSSQGQLPCRAQTRRLTQAPVAQAVAPVATRHSTALTPSADEESRLPRSATHTGRVGKWRVRQEHHRIPLKWKEGELQTLSQGWGHSYSYRAEVLLQKPPVPEHHWSPWHDWESCGDPQAGDPRYSGRRRRLEVARGRGEGREGAGGGGRCALAGPRAPSPAAPRKGGTATAFPREDAP